MVRKKNLIKRNSIYSWRQYDKKIDGYLLIKSINHKFLFKVRPFTTAKTIDMYDHMKPSLRDFNPGLFIIHFDTNEFPWNKNSNEIAEEIVNFAESVKKTQLKHCNFRRRNP